ncbi:MAG TPA: YraN family protein [Gemmatimonadota bacterium]|nr:YraN family protein [Gemmatimonadota bacterium]
MVLGESGEEAAARYLTGKGWRILARRWKGAGREIDLVAKRGGVLALVEVKTRHPGGLAPASAAVDWRKQRQLAAAGTVAAIRWPNTDEVRFDVIGVTWNPDGPAVDHLEDAFRP